MAAPVIQFDYDFSPYGQKTRLVLKAAGVEFKKCNQPVLWPRKDLQALDITYRRIPLLAVGKDIYCDSHRIISHILSDLGHVLTSPADSAFETWGNATFAEILGVLPKSTLTPKFIKDRQSIFALIARPDFTTLRPSALANFHQRLRQIEDEFLKTSDGPFMNGKQLSVADIHIIWPVRWALYDLGVRKEAGFGPDQYPKVWKMIRSLPQTPAQDLSAEQTHKEILSSNYTAKGNPSVQKDDPLGIAAGTPVTVESLDTKRGAHPQRGRLVGTNVDEVVIELANSIRLHFPRTGYIVRAEHEDSSTGKASRI